MAGAVCVCVCLRIQYKIPLSKFSFIPHLYSLGGSFAEFQHDDSCIELDCADNQQFSIWVSFAEIYNEFIYDLLSEPPAKGKQRTALKISEDRNKNHFIKG